MYNEIIDAEWECPFCGTKQNGRIQFKYGALYVYQYKLGDKVAWGPGMGVIYEKRLPGGTGVITGVVSCVNNWEDKWRKAAGPGAVHELFDARTPEQISRYGCPQGMNINIEVVNDEIKRVYFADDPEELFRNL